MEFGKRLKKVRELKKHENSKWTQSYVANKIGVARVTYTAYENGSKLPPLDTTVKIAQLFQVTTDYLLGYSNPEKNNNFDPMSEINRLLDEYGIDQSGFYDIDRWKAMGPEEIKELENYFKYITDQAKKNKKKNDNFF